MPTQEKNPAEIIRQLLTRRGLHTQEAIATRLTKLSGTTVRPSSVSQWVKGLHAPSPNNLQRLLDLLDEPEIDTSADGPARGGDDSRTRSLMIASEMEGVYLEMLLRILRSNHGDAKAAICQNLQCFSELVDIVESKQSPASIAERDRKRVVRQ